MPEKSSTVVFTAKHAWSDVRSLGNDEFIYKYPVFGPKGHLHGGMVISQAIHCAYQTVLKPFEVSSFHSHFVRRGNNKLPIKFLVKRVRDGRNFVFRTVQVLQNEDVIHYCEFSFRKRPDKVELKITHAQFPSVPQPERLKTVAELRKDFQQKDYAKSSDFNDVFKDIVWQFEVRPCSGIDFLLGPQRPVLKQNIWVRYDSEDSRADPNFRFLVMGYLSDIGLMFAGALPYPKSAFQVLSSIDHSGWVHDTNFNLNEHMLLEQECLMRTNGRCLVHSRLWSRQGDLIASFSQEALTKNIQPIDRTPKSKL